jgi:hypothetical protein
VIVRDASYRGERYDERDQRPVKTALAEFIGLPPQESEISLRGPRGAAPLPCSAAPQSNTHARVTIC